MKPGIRVYSHISPFIKVHLLGNGSITRVYDLPRGTKMIGNHSICDASFNNIIRHVCFGGIDIPGRHIARTI
ncbi:hypothetical protein NITGR_10001 [Nitrospina gracilis 3/211]|uniref:Uncharacterized protein n=1 Tax=Nitrospina gracilis (strain 3/211) TaxID=1266370 RepID=M1YUB4_NITG3|nr:hypothetical protein NITGR_10001 [Nitrospina gracilis 3/211]